MNKKIFDFSLKMFLFLSPIFTFKDYQVSFARGMFFVMGAFVLFGLSLSLEPKRRFSNIWLSSLLLLSLLGVFFNNTIGSPESEFFNFWLACSGFIYVFCGVLLFKTVYCHAESVKEYFKPIVCVCIINLVLTTAQFLNHDFMWAQTHQLSRLCGFMETSAQLGQYSAMALPVLFYSNPFLSIIPLVTLFLSRSVTPIAALFAGLLFLGWQCKKKVPVACVTAAVILWAGFNLSYIHAKFYTRPIMWKKTLSLALQKPFLGWGYQSFNDKVVGIIDKGGMVKTPHAYNDYVHTAQELGFPIVIAVGMFLIGMFKKFNMIKDKDKLLICLMASVIVVLVNMLGQGLIRYASVSGTFIVLLALLFVQMEESNAGSIS